MFNRLIGCANELHAYVASSAMVPSLLSWIHEGHSTESRGFRPCPPCRLAQARLSPCLKSFHQQWLSVASMYMKALGSSRKFTSHGDRPCCTLHMSYSGTFSRSNVLLADSIPCKPFQHESSPANQVRLVALLIHKLLNLDPFSLESWLLPAKVVLGRAVRKLLGVTKR